VIYNALRSEDHVEPLFPPGHELRSLVRPTFDTNRRTLRGLYVSAIWVDASHDPSREGFRPSYDSLYGPGSTNVMPFTATWLSTGDRDDPEGNVIALPASIDRTLVDYARSVGLLGAVEYVSGIDELKAKVVRAGRKVYSIDDLGADFDAHSMIGSKLSRWLNTKDQLSTITKHAPTEIVKDMYDVTLDDHAAMRPRGRGRVFLKTCNTESAGAGVFIANSAEEFTAHLAAIREKQQRYSLNRAIVIQPEITGKNRSFQVLLDPRDREHIQVVALTDQLVEDDGKTYKASINHPITPAAVAAIGPTIVDMVERIWAREPTAFGFLMADYFETDEGPVVYDPGIRPTGNTATAMAFHLARKLTGEDLFASLIHLRSGVPGLTFGQFARTMGRLVDPENLRTEKRAVLPWGWNDVQGFGVLIAVTRDEADFLRLRDDVTSRTFR